MQFCKVRPVQFVLLKDAHCPPIEGILRVSGPSVTAPWVKHFVDAKFLDEIQTKVLTVFLLAFQCHSYFYVPASYIMNLSDFCRFLLCTCMWERRGERGSWEGGDRERVIECILYGYS